MQMSSAVSTMQMTMNDNPATPEVVRQTMAETLRWVRDPAAPCIPTLAIRNLYLFLEEEKLSEAVRLNETLAPYWPVLWRVAGSGHYREKGEPVREVPKKPAKCEESAQPENPEESQPKERIRRPPIPSLQEAGYTPRAV